MARVFIWLFRGKGVSEEVGTEAGQQVRGPVAARVQEQASGVFATWVELDGDVDAAPSEGSGEPVGPFDHDHCVSVEHLLEAQVGKFRGLEAIEVEVVEGEPAWVAMVEGEGGAGGRPRGAEAFGEALDEGGLARTEVALEADEVARAEKGGEAPAEGAGLLG